MHFNYYKSIEVKLGLSPIDFFIVEELDCYDFSESLMSFVKLVSLKTLQYFKS